MTNLKNNRLFLLLFNESLFANFFKEMSSIFRRSIRLFNLLPNSHATVSSTYNLLDKMHARLTRVFPERECSLKIRAREASYEEIY